jgi:UDP-galactopyranose mutase
MDTHNKNAGQTSLLEMDDVSFPSAPLVPKPAAAAVLSRSAETCPPPPDLVCLMHLRWDFVFQRPHHLLTRFARSRRVFWVEEAFWEPIAAPRLEVRAPDRGVTVVVPHLPEALRGPRATSALRRLMDGFMAEHAVDRFALWYYTPMALAFTDHLDPDMIVYDCMDDLASFKGAPALVGELEAELFARADVAFTGGVSLWEAKREQCPEIHAFPSSIDVAHFRHAREPLPDPVDQAVLGHPRLGYFGVIDERMDLELIEGVARARPDWHLVFIGPLAKIGPEDLPVAPNLHFLGKRAYEGLADYVANWDVAILPFARNEATRFISPTKTPEYLAAGRPVVSTSIRDVVRPYAEKQLVHIADTVDTFVAAAEKAMAEDSGSRLWLQRVDALLAGMSWDRTWQRMSALVESALERRRREGAPIRHRLSHELALRPTVRSYGEV